MASTNWFSTTLMCIANYLMECVALGTLRQELIIMTCRHPSIYSTTLESTTINVQKCNYYNYVFNFMYISPQQPLPTK